MKISSILKSKTVTLSFEVFPPKKADGFEAVEQAARSIAALRPDFMSVTYGAGGTTDRYTLALAETLQSEAGVTVLPHLTCVSSSRAYVEDMLKRYEKAGICNIMALRGDIPEGGRTAEDFRYACDLIRFVRERSDLCIGGACYPEGHVESASKAEDIRHLKEKVEAGCDFLTTQMFFDNTILFNFLYRAREAGIMVPVVAGIMPVTTAAQLRRSVSLSGTQVPERFRAIVDHYGSDPAAMKQAGIIYACEQIIDLIASGITHIHVYSMNKPDVAFGIQRLLEKLL
ncbi:MAG: methylenetetrahydrofolate reductase [NAD(P)H] [Lachnospiraceae bacterium]|nr:methylenetetrahydrofolate reductase [NAD(P)H] [Lachnospiraceae bacterium]